MKVEYIFYDGSDFVFDGKRIHLSKMEIYLCECMDGKNAVADLKQEFYKKYSFKLSNEALNGYIRKFKKNNLLAAKANGRLVGKLSKTFKDKQLARFTKENIRKPTYAGLCYNNNSKQLNKDLKTCFASVDDRRLAALGLRKKKIRGIIVPHSNIELSGSCAAWAYKALTYGPKPDVFVVLAPNHSTSLIYPFSVLAKDFRMPLGVVKADRGLAEILRKKCNFNIFNNAVAHIKEYSVEIQLSFLQYLYRSKKGGVKILPILCAARPLLEELSSIFNGQRSHFLEILKEAISESGKNVVFVATGDLLHIDRWGGTPRFHEKNKKIIHSLERLDIRGLKQNLVPGEKGSCGEGSFYALFELLEDAKGKMLNYSWTSNANLIKNNKENSQFEQSVDIGYASMVFY